MISEQTNREVREQLTRWARKHKIRRDQMEELLRWIQKAKGNASFTASVQAVYESYKDAPDGPSTALPNWRRHMY